MDNFIAKVRSFVSIKLRSALLLKRTRPTLFSNSYVSLTLLLPLHGFLAPGAPLLRLQVQLPTTNNIKQKSIGKHPIRKSTGLIRDFHEVMTRSY